MSPIQEGLLATEEYEDAVEQGYRKALLLAWFASQSKALFAAKCLVETVVQMYRAGYTLDDVKLSISLGGLEYGGQLLSPLHEDLLLSWVAIVMMTLKQVGVPLSNEGAARLQTRGGSGELTEGSSRMTRGMQNFVKQIFTLYLNGTDLYRLQLAQSMAGNAPKMEGGEGGEGPSPAMQIMQQNTRLVIITLEVVKGMGLPTEVALTQSPAPSAGPAAAAAAAAGSSASASEAGAAEEEGSDSEDAEDADAPSSSISSSPFGQFGPVGYIPSFLPPAHGSLRVPGAAVASIAASAHPARSSGSSSDGGGSSNCKVEGAAGTGESVSLQEQQRAAAVRLLIGFMGAAMGWLYSTWDFIDSVADCYQLGWTADELFTQLKDEEFAQSGGVLPVGVAGMGSPQQISASLFANWLSLVYMTMAQLGVPHPGAGEQLGWAWVASVPEDEALGPAELQAQGIAGFVSKALEREAQREAQQAAAAGTADAAATAGGTAGRSAAGGGASLSDDEAPPGWTAAAEAPAHRLSQQQQGFAVIEDPDLAKTSGFALLLSQQLSLVQMTRQRVLAAMNFVPTTATAPAG
ncbi:hypothetical protein N2152v2_001469 [Parachlorella kessleri]